MQEEALEENGRPGGGRTQKIQGGDGGGNQMTQTTAKTGGVAEERNQ